jgi:DNA-binding transcriptional regulator YhcF (GntR family)
MVPNVFLERYAELNITPSEAMLLILLASFKWTKQAPFPSIQRLAKQMRCSERNIRKLCKSLESVGIIKRIAREGTSNQFDLSGLYTKLEEIIAKEEAEEMAPTPVNTVGMGK